MAELMVARRSAIHAALADPHRLEIVDELALSDRSPSELSASLAIGSNLLAHHLKVLEDASVVERVASAGDARRRYVRLVPGALAVVAEPTATLVVGHMLFVCTENSARSQLAAASWTARHEVPTTSAGTRPAAKVHPQAIAAAGRAGLDLRSTRPRSVDEVAESPDLVVTVCDAAREELGARSHDATVLHWSVPDPARGGRRSDFDLALSRLDSRVEVLAPHIRPSRLRRSSR